MKHQKIFNVGDRVAFNYILFGESESPSVLETVGYVNKVDGEVIYVFDGIRLHAAHYTHVRHDFNSSTRHVSKPIELHQAGQHE